jgi:heme exporter protein C
MKALIVLSGIVVGLLMGFFPGIDKKRPMWWQLTAIAIVTVTVALALAPPLGGNFADAVILSRMETPKPMPLKAEILHDSFTFDGSMNVTAVRLKDFSSKRVEAIVLFDGDVRKELQAAETVIVTIRREANDAVFRALQIESFDPLLSLPFLPGLEERGRNLFFHVPMAWVGALAYLVSMFFGYRYLKTDDLHYDTISSSSAALGTLFTILATITGAIWAKFNWGMYWNWDPRQTSIFVLLLIYGAYFALRSALDNEVKRAKLSSVYAMLSAVAAIFLVYVMPRLVEGLHPGSADSPDIGPVLSQEENTLNPVKQVIFALSMTSFTAIFYWMLSLQVRLKRAVTLVQ